MIKTLSPEIQTHDQARSLRELIHQEESRHHSEESLGTQCRALAIVSGKGGVGKSLLALNLAVALAQSGQKVCLLDANLGLGSLELMCGLNGYWNLSHVITGARQLADVVLAGPAGIDLIPGGSAITEIADCEPEAQESLLAQLHQLETAYDHLIIDTGAGMHRLMRRIARAADQLLVVTTPEPTSITGAYATIKSLCGTPQPAMSLVVNQVDSTELANKIGDRLQHTTKMFLHADVDCWEPIPSDAAVPQSINARQPLITFQPTSPAANVIGRLATRWHASPAPRGHEHPFFTRLFQSLQRAA